MGLFVFFSFGSIMLAQNTVTFSVTSGGTAVEGIVVETNGISVETNASGEALFDLPSGDYTYSVFTSGSPEIITIGGVKFHYLDIDERGNSSDPYDNVFVNSAALSVSGNATVNVALTTTTFNTTIGGSAASVEFEIIGFGSFPDKSNMKTIARLTSDASGDISLPIPTHLSSGAIIDYSYSAINGAILNTFDPASSPVTIALPAISDVTFSVTAGGTAVGGIMVEVNGKEAQTNASGEVTFSLHHMDYTYSVYTTGSPERIVVGPDILTYLDIDGNGTYSDPYDNIFVSNAALSVSGTATENVALTTTTFNTTVAGSAASAEFDIIGTYSGGKTKTIAKLTSDASGSISLPIPTHRNTRQNDTLMFNSFMFSVLNGLTTGTFNPETSPVAVAVPALNDVTFSVTAGGTAVEGIKVDVQGFTAITNASGEAVLRLPDGAYLYSIYTDDLPEQLIVGANTFTYNDEGERPGRENSYDNIFVANSPLTVSGTTAENVALTTTTFNTTVEGSTASVEFDIIGTYSGSKTKTITTVTTDAAGTISLPIPTHRNRRQGDTLLFSSYMYSAGKGLITATFDPLSSPVDIAIPAFNEVTFNVTSGGTAVEGITVDVMGIKAITDASGNVMLNLPDGNYLYSIYTIGTPEEIKIGANTFTYNDEGGRDNREDRYENIFVANRAITISGAATENVALTATTFNTTVGGSAASVHFDIIGTYSGSKTKTIANVISDASGTIALPLPTHRSTRRGDTLSWDIYTYSAAFGVASGNFDPAVSPVNIAIPTLNEVTFNVTSGGTVVEGITVDVMGTKAKTDASGQVMFNMPDGIFSYAVYTDGTPEVIAIGATVITYNDEGERDDRTDRYDNIFVQYNSFTVSGNSTENVALATTTFNTTVGGSAAPVAFDIIGMYSGNKNKTITSVTSNASGSISLPLPTHRNTRRGDTLIWDSYLYSTANGTLSNSFDPLVSPVEIAMGAPNDVTFYISAGGTAVEGITIAVAGTMAVTDQSGQVMFSLPDGKYEYSIFTRGETETITIGTETFTYLDIAGRDNNPDPYDNIFVVSDSVTISGSSPTNITLTTTTFNTSTGGSAGSIDFDVIGTYDGGKTKTIIKLTSSAGGTVTLPLPSHRDNRRGDILAFTDYHYSASMGTVVGQFFPGLEPVNIDIPALNSLTFSVTANGTAVEGITVDVDGNTGVTDAMGQVVLELPNGYFNYLLYTTGSPEMLSIGGTTFTYNDMGGSNTPDAYDNIFHTGFLGFFGDATENVSLATTTFTTRIGGTATQAQFDINAYYWNENGQYQNKTITSLTSEADGNITLPLPSHRTNRQGAVLEFIDYEYADLLGSISGEFNPENSPVIIDFPALNEVTFSVTDGTNPVEGIVVTVGNLSTQTNSSGQAVLSLPDGMYDYMVHTQGTNEQFTIGGETFTFINEARNIDEFPDPYDLIFSLGAISVSGNASENVTLTSTTFNTSVGGTAASISFKVGGEYTNGDGQLITKRIIVLTSDASGNISLPLPTHRTSRMGEIHIFSRFIYADITESEIGEFDPTVSPVNIDLSGTLLTLTFNVTNSETGNPVVDAIINLNGSDLPATNVDGQTMVGVFEGIYSYSVTKKGYDPVPSTGFRLSNDSTINVVMKRVPATGNEAPVVTDSLPDITENEGFGTRTVDLTNVFTDPDGDMLSYSASSNNTGIATVSVSGTTLTITEVGTGTVDIMVTADDGNGGTGTDTFVFVNTPASGFTAYGSTNNIRIYPNPSTGSFYIESSDESPVMGLSVLDLTGKTILKKELNTSKEKVDLSTHSKGVYFIMINNEKGTSINKIIIK